MDLIEFFPLSIFKKFFELKEKTASTVVVPVLVNLYSIAPTGRLELSSSVGIKGLQPVTVTFSGRSVSLISR